jgi:hypothetical protein
MYNIEALIKNLQETIYDIEAFTMVKTVGCIRDCRTRVKRATSGMEEPLAIFKLFINQSLFDFRNSSLTGEAKS